MSCPTDDVPLRVGLVAGESSGDLLAAGLIDALRKRVPDAAFEGVTGPEMLEAGCERWADSDRLAVMGFVEPLRHLPELLRLRRSLVDRWRRSPPDVFIGVDAPDFNLGLEAALRKSGIPTVQYVSPSIWAWRPGRIRKIKKAVDCVLCLLPFEPDLYREHQVAAVFVGHPKAGLLSPEIDKPAARAALGLPSEQRVVAVLPGSRSSEVTRLAPIFAAAARRVAASRDDIHFVTPVAHGKLRPFIEQQLREQSVAGQFTLLDRRSLDAMAAADIVLLASGTAALESALLGKPTIAAYRVAPLTALIMRLFRLVKVRHFTLPNLLTGEALIPEFIQGDARPGPIAGELVSMLDDPKRRDAIRSRFAKLRDELALDANERAADAVMSLVAQKHG